LEFILGSQVVVTVCEEDCRLGETHETDKVKRAHFSFSGVLLTDKKLQQIVLGQFSIQPIILFLFVLLFLLLE
jgi:hypothetical protein